MPAVPPRLRRPRLLAPLVLSPLLLACAPVPGEVSLLVEPESVIIEGLSAGSGREDVQDGWSVTFSKYILTLGQVELRHIQSGVVSQSSESWAVDLVRLPARGEKLWTLSEVEPGRSDVFYSTPAADFERHDSVGKGDFEELVDAEATHLIVGTLTHPSGTSCPPSDLAEVPADAEPVGENASGDACYATSSIAFRLLVGAEVTYGPCSIDGVPGLAVESGATSTAALSLHGDHLFFGGFPEGSEGEVRRYAQWLADCDLDLDGTVTGEELERIPLAELSEFDARFPLGGSPIRPLDDVLDYVRSQLSTQGHFQGEGECALGFAR